MFSTEEIDYIKTQHLARLATVSPDGQPDVAPVGFQFDGQRFTIGGFDITKTFKYKNVKQGSLKVALVIDDLVSVSPWQARGIKIHGLAQIVEGSGPAYLIITPERSWSWGVGAAAFEDGKPVSRKARHTVAK
ncbi:MAG: PPOX class F420-dependent oxidoreductase [Chloroflexi bacterium]|nr:PPOX class F420-dependent oxidoreductase [Chloroflexota bacterium]